MLSFSTMRTEQGELAGSLRPCRQCVLWPGCQFITKETATHTCTAAQSSMLSKMMLRESQAGIS